MNYDLYLHSTYIGTYTAKGVADKLDVTPGYVMKATREHKKIKNKWTTIRSDRELTDTKAKNNHKAEKTENRGKCSS